MTRPLETYEKHDSEKSSLKSLQADLSKYKENFKHQESKFEQLAAEANHLNPRNRHNAKPATITFKKSKSRQTSKYIYTNI